MGNPSIIAGGPTPRNRPPFTPVSYTPQAAADVVSIGNLMARYCHLLDQDGTEGKAIASLFHEQGSVQPLYEGERRHVGREAVQTWFDRYLSASRSGSRLRRHLMSAVRIEVEGDRGWAFAMLDAQGIDIKSDQLRFYAGSYEDDLVKSNGRWYFSLRRISLDYQWHAPAYTLCRNGKQVMAGEAER